MLLVLETKDTKLLKGRLALIFTDLEIRYYKIISWNKSILIKCLIFDKKNLMIGSTLKNKT